MRAELSNLNDCAVPFLSRVAVNLCWHNYTAKSCTQYTYMILYDFFDSFLPFEHVPIAVIMQIVIR